MFQGDEARDGDRVLPHSADAMLDDLGNSEHLHAVVDLVDPTIAPASQADQSDPQQARGPNRPRAGSYVSSVNVDYFDPRGVNELRHTLSRMSTAPSERTQVVGRDELLPVVEEAFDFEAVLRDVLKRCDVRFPMFRIRTEKASDSQA